MDESQLDIACIILAAGAGSRYGGDKMLHLLEPDRTMIDVVLSKYRPIFKNITVVIRAGDQALKHRLLDKSLNVVENDLFQQGVASSIVSGIGSKLDADGWLIALGDMPFVQSATVNQVKLAMSENNIVAPIFSGQRGHPVGFGSEYRAQLLELSGDTGAKRLIEDNLTSLNLLPCSDEGVVLDIDYR